MKKSFGFGDEAGIVAVVDEDVPDEAASEATASVRAICCYTHSGYTAALVSRERPDMPILAITPFEAAARRLCLSWGINCVVAQAQVADFEEAVLFAIRAAKSEGLASADDHIVVTAGVPFNVTGTTHIVRAARCDERAAAGQHDLFAAYSANQFGCVKVPVPAVYRLVVDASHRRLHARPRPAPRRSARDLCLGCVSPIVAFASGNSRPVATERLP